MSENRNQLFTLSKQIRNTLWSTNSMNVGVSGQAYLGASVLVGAGMSRNAVVDPARGHRPPDWSEVSRDLVRALVSGGAEAEREQLERTGAVSGFLRIAQIYKARFSRAQLEKFITEKVNDDSISPGTLHHMLVSLPWADIFSTNWDTLLERAGKANRVRTYDTVLKASDLPTKRRPRIIKLHGTIGVNEKMIFTEEDFRTYHQYHAPFVNTVRQSIMESILVMIGFSGEDPNFLAWSGWVRDQMGDFQSQIYLVDDFTNSLLHREILEERGVTMLDLGQITREDLRDRQITGDGLDARLEWWLRFLQEGEKPPLTVWPLGVHVLHRPSPPAMQGEDGGLHPAKTNGSTIKDRIFLSLKAQSEWASVDVFDRLIKELSELRDSYRGWLVMPADARDVLSEALARWRPMLSPLHLRDGQVQADEQDYRLRQFLPLCLGALEAPRPDERMREIFRNPGANAPEPTKEFEQRIDMVRQWIGEGLMNAVRTVLCDFLWLCDITMEDWPNDLAEVIRTILGAASDPDAHATEAGKDVLSRDHALALADAYLRKCREAGVKTSEWDAARELARAVVTRHGGSEEMELKIALTEAGHAHDRGARARAGEILRECEGVLSNSSPCEAMRYSALLDEIADNESESELCRSLRIAAYQKARERITPILTNFDAVSTESWLLALETNGKHEFLEAAGEIDGAVPGYRKRGLNTRLDELKVLRCDPVRELRRAKRNIANRALRRQALRSFERAGVPLIARKCDQELGVHVPELLLEGFIWDAAQAEVSDLARLAARHKKSNGFGINDLDHICVQALRLLFRYCSDPKVTPLSGAERNLTKSILLDVSDAAQDIMTAASGSRPLDLRCLHFCLDVLGETTQTGPSKCAGKENVLLAAVLIMGALLLPPRTSWTGTRVDDQWDRDLSIKAVRRLTAIRRSGSIFDRIDGTVLSTMGVPNGRQLVEALLNLGIAKALQHADAVSETFEVLWDDIEADSEQADADFVEPFRLLTAPGSDRDQWEAPDFVDTALAQLRNGGKISSEKRANLIRLLDAMIDWKCKLSDSQSSDFRDLVLSEFQKLPEERATLEHWEWLMLDDVQTNAAREFVEWAFEKDHSVDATTEAGRNAAKNLTKSFYWATCQERVGMTLDASQVLVLLTWIQSNIDCYRNAGMEQELVGSSHFRRLFVGLLKDKDHLSDLDGNGVELALEILYELHALGILIEPVIPRFAAVISQFDDRELRLRRLGSLLRQGLAMVHYPERRAEFDAAIEAVLGWIDQCEEIGGCRPPPPALLGALGQALAVPEMDRGNRILRAIRKLLRIRNDDEKIDVAADLVVDLRRRVDRLLASSDRLVKGPTERMITELQEVYEALTDSPAGVVPRAELKRLGERIEGLSKRAAEAPDTATKADVARNR